MIWAIIMVSQFSTLSASTLQNHVRFEDHHDRFPVSEMGRKPKFKHGVIAWEQWRYAEAGAAVACVLLGSSGAVIIKYDFNRTCHIRAPPTSTGHQSPRSMKASNV
jgi:hypothetical protein